MARSVAPTGVVQGGLMLARIVVTVFGVSFAFMMLVSCDPYQSLSCETCSVLAYSSRRLSFEKGDGLKTANLFVRARAVDTYPKRSEHVFCAFHIGTMSAWDHTNGPRPSRQSTHYRSIGPVIVRRLPVPRLLVHVGRHRLFDRTCYNPFLMPRLM